HVLVTVVRAYAYDVALVADDINQLELLEHRRQRVESLADLGPRFDGDTDRRTAVVEIETDKRVRNRPDLPIRNEQIDRDHMRHVELALLPVAIEIVAAAIGEVAVASQQDVVTVDDCFGQDRNLGSPRTVLRRRDKNPPNYDSREDTG